MTSRRLTRVLVVVLSVPVGRTIPEVRTRTRRRTSGSGLVLVLPETSDTEDGTLYPGGVRDG